VEEARQLYLRALDQLEARPGRRPFPDPNFGRIGQAYPARSIQFGLKMYF